MQFPQGLENTSLYILEIKLEKCRQNTPLMFKTIQVQVWNLHQVPQHRLSKHGMKKIKSDNCDKICDKIENIYVNLCT